MTEPALDLSVELYMDRTTIGFLLDWLRDGERSSYAPRRAVSELADAIEEARDRAVDSGVYAGEDHDGS